MRETIRAGGTGVGARRAKLVVRCVLPDGSDDGRAIDSIGGVDELGRPWHLPLDEAVALARRGTTFLLQRPAAVTHVAPRQLVPLHVVVNDRGTAFLRAEGGQGARLRDLPRCTHLDRLPPDLQEDGPLIRGCREAVAYLQEHCPDLLPTKLDPGQQADPVPLDQKRVSSLVQAAAQQSAWRSIGFAGDEQDAPRAVLWRDGPDSLLVLLDSVRVETEEGVVTVSVEVSCDQLPARTNPARVFVDLVVGTDERPTGMLVAASAPRGPDVVTQRWDDALVAFAWRAMIDASAGMGAALGHDVDGAPLVPNRWSATRAGLALGTQARHSFDRIGLGVTGVLG